MRMYQVNVTASDSPDVAALLASLRWRGETAKAAVGGLPESLLPTSDGLGEMSSSRNSRLALLLADVELPGTGRVVCENRGRGISVMRPVMRRAGRQPRNSTRA